MEALKTQMISIIMISNKKAFRLTNSMNPVIDKKHLGNAEIIRFNSFDGLEIPLYTISLPKLI